MQRETEVMQEQHLTDSCLQTVAEKKRAKEKIGLSSDAERNKVT